MCFSLGIYVPLFFVTVYLLLLRPRGDRINKSLVFASFFLFVLATMHVAGSLKELFDAFIFFRDGPKGPAGIFAHEAEGESNEFWTLTLKLTLPLAANIFRKSVAALSIVVGDSLVIYRCYVIWGRDWRVTVLPIALLIFSIGRLSLPSRRSSDLADTILSG